MVHLNIHAKESIKIALAVVIAYAIAMELGWEKPFWSVFGVLFISLDTAGQSLNKGALRMLGTLVGGAMAFIMLSLFVQHRWLMVFSLSIYYGICVYLLTGSKRPYFWFVCAFVCMVIMVDTSPVDSLRIFQIVVARVEETAMGILVYSLISVLLWPRSSRSDLYEASRALSETPAPAVEKVQPRRFTIDPDRLAGALLVAASQWVGFFIWIYMDPPGHALFVFLVSMWTMLSVMGRINPLMLWPGFVFGLVLGGIVYIFIMPHLSGYFQLGLMLFIVTFGAFYFLPAGLKTGAMAVFHVVIGINNQQTYSFAGYANTAAAILISLGCVVVLFYMVGSPHPEKVFLRRLRRFFRQAEFLMSRLALDRDERKGLARRWRMALYSDDLLGLPDKLAALGQKIDYRLLSGQTPEQVQAVATSLQSMAYRIKDLVDARKFPLNHLLGAAVIDDVRAWRLLAQKQLHLWADDPAKAVEPDVGIQERLMERITKLEEKIGESLRGIEEDQLSQKDFENFYRFLGAFRGLSESGIAFEREAKGVDWAMWKEERF